MMQASTKAPPARSMVEAMASAGCIRDYHIPRGTS